MLAYNRDDDALGLIAILVIGILALLFIMQFCNVTAQQACPAGSYECASSPCGCCKQNQDGSVDICSACADYISVGNECCAKSNPQNCISSIKQCVYPVSCASDAECGADPCPMSKCETQSDGTSKCKPCTVGAVCNADDPNSCCKGMVCSNGKCEEQAKCIFSCTKDSECSSVPGCSLFGCNTLTKLCENCDAKPCTTRADCCSGAKWNCVEGVCVDCFGSCDPLLQPKCACDGTVCQNGKCTGCEEGAPCDANNPCCSDPQKNLQCNLQTGKCESCSKQCTGDEECCKDGLCIQGACRYGDSCTNLSCSNPGEVCKLCSSSDSCITCTDNTICAKSENGFVCKQQGNCKAGQYECDKATCPTGCCDAITGECVCGDGGHPCQGIEGCNCCKSGSRTILVCPENMFLCNGYGCTKPSIDCTTIGGKIECTINQPKCTGGTFQCSTDPSSCCTYIIPSDGIPSGVRPVDTLKCYSGYAYGLVISIGGTSLPVIPDKCCESVTSTKTGNIYSYKFICDGTTFTGTSSVSAYEYIVTSALQFPQDYCREVAKSCIERGIPLSKCFTIPQKIYISESGIEASQLDPFSNFDWFNPSQFQYPGG